MNMTNISVQGGDGSSYEIKKHSSLVQMGNVTTLQERKAMNALIRIAKDILKSSPDENYFECDIGTVRRLAGINTSDNVVLKDALRNLKMAQIEYNVLNKDREEWGIFSFLAEVKIITRGRGKSTTVSFEFPSSILKVIKHPSMYVKLDLYVIRGLESKHSVALYEMMKDYQKIGIYTCSITAFKKLMGIEESQYKIFTMLRKRVLDRAISEINDKTDIYLSYHLVKEGRKITAIKITVESTRPSKTPEGDLANHVTDKLKRFGISKKVIQTLIDKHDLEYLLANIKIVEDNAARGGVKNPTAYLMKAIQNDYRPLKTVQNANENEKTEELDREKTDIDIEKIKGFIETLSTDQLEEYKANYILYVNDNPFFKKILENKGFDSDIIKYQWFRFVERIM